MKKITILLSLFLVDLTIGTVKLPFSGLPDTIKVLVSSHGDETPRTLS